MFNQLVFKLPPWDPFTRELTTLIMKTSVLMMSQDRVPERELLLRLCFAHVSVCY